MNLFKTAFLNVRKCSKDYSVYFFTLIIGVAIFYMFNSVGSQGFMETMVASSNSTIQSLVQVISFISVGVAVIFGLLMIYANNFLIKRRKKEFGIYTMLGMSKRRVAAILSVETILVGIVSLVIGLFVGVLGSQFLSIIVAKMFAADLSAYRFIFSSEVLFKTVLYFALIFMVVLVFNAKSLTKYELIDLLNAKKSGEKKLIRNSKLSFVLFVIGFVALLFAYIEVGVRGSELVKKELVASFLAGLFGTFAFFFGLAGFLPGFLKRFKGFYFDKLNAFVSGQFGHNLNSSAVAFSIISIMLFLSIGAFSVGFSMNGYLNKRLENATPVDVSAYYNEGSLSEHFKDKGYDVDFVMGEYCEMPVYNSQYVTMESTVKANFEKAKNTFFSAKWDSQEYVVRLSDYNRLERLYGREELSLADDEYAITCDFDMLEEIISEAMKMGNTINVGDVELKSGYDACIYEYVLMSGTTATMGVVVLPDCVIDNRPEDFTEIGSILAGNYGEGLGAEGNSADEDAMADRTGVGDAIAGRISVGDTIFEEIYADVEDEYSSFYSTATQVKENNVGTSVSVVFIVLYIGIIFIITSAAVIALKILSDSMDSVEKYSILKRVGADRQMCKNALFAQTLFNFALPFALGLVDALFGLQYAKGLLNALGMGKMFSGTVIAVCVMILVYGGYFLVTYGASKRIVFEENYSI